jgi:hypothetical protein
VRIIELVAEKKIITEAREKSETGKRFSTRDGRVRQWKAEEINVRRESRNGRIS